MDIKSATTNQFSNATSLYSLILQNHLYGCFIIMEDIALEKFEMNGTVLSTPTFTFDLDKQFSEIGIRYGFIMDTKLNLECNSEYKDTWIAQFKSIHLEKSIETVDKIEDSLIETIQNIKPDDAFFINALETGSLPQEWIEKVLKLLNSTTDAMDAREATEATEVKKNTISTAITEKPIRRGTRHLKPKIVSNKPLSKTRRNRSKA